MHTTVIPHMSIFQLLSLTSNSEGLLSRLAQFIYRHLQLLFFRLNLRFALQWKSVFPNIKSTMQIKFHYG